jgi:hypothetical protein
MFQIFRNFKPVDLASLRCQNKLSHTASRLVSSFTKKITLPEINNENLRASVLGSANKNNKDYKFYCLYGYRAYTYYAIKTLNVKYPDVARNKKITDILLSKGFLTEIAKVCELDKMLSDPNSSGNLGEKMGAYCSGMLFNGMEEEMVKFTSDVIDYYFANAEKVNFKEIKKKTNDKLDKPDKPVKPAKPVKSAKISRKLKKRNLLLEV